MKKGFLWNEILKTSQSALASGSLQPLATEYEFIEDAGVRFLVRVLRSLRIKDEEKVRQQQRGPIPNPFLPYEKELFVAEISDTHVALLNKFNVVDHHILIVTRVFEEQEALLSIRDFHSIWSCMAEYEGLAFYNGGVVAGASQRHKHLQMVPLPLAPEGPPVPVEPLLARAVFHGKVGIVPGLPFQHIFTRFDKNIAESPLEAAEETFGLYNEMFPHVGLSSVEKNGTLIQSGPYCLLMTRDWMLLVPRSNEFFGQVSVNSLGFAGALLVKEQEQLAELQRFGPMAALRSVALPLK